MVRALSPLLPLLCIGIDGADVVGCAVATTGGGVGMVGDE